MNALVADIDDRTGHETAPLIHAAEGADEVGSDGSAVVRVRENLVAEVETLVADEDGRAAGQPLNLSFGFPAERAGARSLAVNRLRAAESDALRVADRLQEPLDLIHAAI